MKYNYAIEELVFTPARAVNRKKILQLSSCTWGQETLNVSITGATGSEKTFWGCTLGNAVCRNSFKVLLKRVLRLLTALAIAV